MPRKLEPQSTQELVKAFAKAAKDQGEALHECNPKKANRRTKLIHKTFAEIKQRGQEAWQQFLFLLNDPEPYVRYFAATYALRPNPGLAIPVLERLDQEERGILAFRASLALNNGSRVIGVCLDGRRLLGSGPPNRSDAKDRLVPKLDACGSLMDAPGRTYYFPTG